MKTDRSIHNSVLGVLITAAAALICVVIDYLTKEENCDGCA